MGHRLDRSFYLQDVLEVAPALLGKKLVMDPGKGGIRSYTISETEAYRGGDDLACHASKGRTPRTDIMFSEGGHIYMYLIYGMYWMMNVVTADRDVPQAVLIRGLQEVSGPGRLTRQLGLDRAYHREDLVHSQRIWIEDAEMNPAYTAAPRVGIQYAGEPWISKPWRFLMTLKP